jgi:hypothetical protein
MRGREQMTHLRLAIGRHREARLALLGAEMGGPASRQCRETPVSPNHRTPARPLHSAVKHEEAHRGAHQQRALGRHPRGGRACTHTNPMRILRSPIFLPPM